jgi:hypothetical protein
MPWLMTWRASWVRELTPSLRNTLRRWYSTVLGLTNSWAAISREMKPRRRQGWSDYPCADRGNVGRGVNLGEPGSPRGRPPTGRPPAPGARACRG